jgi:hypothetical protein
MPSVRVVGLLLVIVSGVSLSAAQEENRPNPKLAFSSAAEAGIDFAWQGEYRGYYGAWGAAPGVGLQVISRGDSRFDAVLYAGGLPGGGWDGRPPSNLSGSRDGERLSLESVREQVVITPEGAALKNAAGRTAHLRKVERRSWSLGSPPPPGATVLFNGTSLELFARGAAMTEDGLLKEGAITSAPVGDFQIHLEFQLPYMPYARGQGRGNSGVYIQQRYEVQILDSFGLSGEANECAGLYRQTAPDVNMCLPPLAWQTYDIFFHPAQWNSRGEKIGDAQITVLHNGFTVHNGRVIPTKTGAGKAESPELLPITLQNHGDPVRFRNIWIKPIEPIPTPVEVATTLAK